MHMKARFIVITSLALVTGTAAAADWQPLFGNAEGFCFLVDAASLTRHGNIVRAWVRVVYDEPREAAGEKYLSSLARLHVDCAERREALKQLTSFADKEFNEAVIVEPSTDDALLEWRDVPPDSPAEELLEFVCSKAPK
jgi:hypothetical protein